MRTILYAAIALYIAVVGGAMAQPDGASASPSAALGRASPQPIARAFGNPFGMQLRPAPVRASAAWAPAIVRAAPTNECSLIARRDGSLEIYSVTKPESDSVSVIRSRDGGITWSEPDLAFRLPGRAYYAVVVLEARDGGLHAVYHLQSDGPGGYRGRLYEVWHTRQAAGASDWTEPQRVVPGYVGSINGFVQLRASGRLLLAVGRAIPEREQRPQQGPDHGWNDTFVYFSDDHGVTWQQSLDQLSLELATTNVTRYGAIEPALLEMRDGRVWMLVRDRGGQLWQSYSQDGGAHWPALERSPFISSDSPADMVRLRNGRIVLLTNACQNWSNPRSYAMGGREVLHAAISADEGKSWRGFREILHETNVASRGDRGASYASGAENADGKLVIASGQGEGNRAILIFDPRWLEEDGAANDLRPGPVEWTQYGSAGIRVEKLADGGSVLAIASNASGPSGALWNFPMADAGEIVFRLQVPRGARDVRLSISDHFNRIDDADAPAHSVYSIRLDAFLSGRKEEWHNVRLAWSGAADAGALAMAVDGEPARRVAAQRRGQFGVNYLRIEFHGAQAEGPLLITDLSSQRRERPQQ